MASLDEVLAIRDKHWDGHPLVCMDMLLPTKAIADVIKLVTPYSRAARASIAFWADPETGKSQCIVALQRSLKDLSPGAAIVVLDAKDATTSGEAALWADFLVNSLDYSGVLPVTSPTKMRLIAYKALYAISAESKRLYFLIDEAQALKEIELRWLKSALNKLRMRGIRYVVIAFGQRELGDAARELRLKGRSDLFARFVKRLYEFGCIRGPIDLKMPFRACDDRSEYPPGSGLSFTQFVFPRAYATGLRLADHCELAFNGLIEAGFKGKIGMNTVSELLSFLALACRDKDAPSFALSERDWLRAAIQAQPDLDLAKSGIATLKNGTLSTEGRASSSGGNPAHRYGRTDRRIKPTLPGGSAP